MKSVSHIASWLVALAACAALALPLLASAENLPSPHPAAAATESPTPADIASPPARGEETDTAFDSPLPVVAFASGTATQFDSPLLTPQPTLSAFDSPLLTPQAATPGTTGDSPLATPTFAGTVVFVSPIGTPTGTATATVTVTATTAPTATAAPALTPSPTVSLIPAPPAPPPGNIRIGEYLAAGAIMLVILYLFAKALLRALR
ncbi:MAG: hypothetical protein ACYC5O_07830 [Anaerolineae bacterium]